MPQWTSINIRMPKPVSEPQSVGNTRATDIRNSSIGEAPTKNLGGPEVPMRSTTSPAIQHLDLPSPQERVPQGPGANHARMTSRQRKQSNKWLKRAMRLGPAKFALEINNSTRLPVNPPVASGPSRSAPIGYSTGPSHNVPVPEFPLTDQRARSPPKAPKAMTSQSGSPQAPPTGRFNSIQSGKQPPTGPKADTTPRNSPKGPKGQRGGARSRAMGHSNSNPKRRKYVPARKLRSLGNSFGATSAMSNPGPSNSQRAMQSTSPKVHMRESIPVAKRAPPPKIQPPNSKGKNVLPAKSPTSYGNQAAPRFFPQSQRLQSNSSPTNSSNNLTNAFNNSAPVMRHEPKHQIASSRSTPFCDSNIQPPSQTAAGLESTKKSPAPWDKYYVRTSTVSSKDAASDASLEQVHQVHPARLDYFNPNYSTPSPELDIYICPPTKSDSDIFAYKDGDVIGAKAREIPATNKGRLMLERMGYTPGVSLGRSGKQKAEIAVATMKMGRGGLGREPKGSGSQGVRSHENHTAIAATPPQSQSLRPLLEENNRGDLVLRYSSYQDDKTVGAKEAGDISQLSKTTVQDNRRGIDTSSHGSAKERVVIVIDSDDDEESVHEVSQQEMEHQEDQYMQETQGVRGPHNLKVGAELEVIAIKEDAGDSSEDENGDVEMQDIPDCVVDNSHHGSHSSQVEQVASQFIQQDFDTEDPMHSRSREQSRGEVWEGGEGMEKTEEGGEEEEEREEEKERIEVGKEEMEAEGEVEGDLEMKKDEKGKEDKGEENPHSQEPGTGGQFNEAIPRWKLPPFQYYPGSCRPAVPMRLFDLVIIERLEQVALGDIFQCINAFEEESHRLTGPAFNYLLVRSFSRVRDMFMHDPLRGVDQETCEGIVKEEFGALLTHPTASSC